MNCYRSRFPLSSVAAAITCVFLAAVETSAEDGASLIVRRLPQTVFAESKFDVEIALPENVPAGTRIVWSLESLQHRTLARNELTPLSGRTLATVALQLPKLEEGVILPLVFNATVGRGAAVQRKLWVFPRSA